MIFDREIAGCPATSPPLGLSSGRADDLGRLVGSQKGLLMKEQGKAKAWDGLDSDSSASDDVARHL